MSPTRHNTSRSFNLLLDRVLKIPRRLGGEKFRISRCASPTSTLTPLHHCTIFCRMRLTINLDDDLYAMARSHAIAERTSISKAVGDLLRQRISPAAAESPQSRERENGFSIDPDTLLPVVRGDGRALSSEDVQRAIDDDDTRVMEAAGWNPTRTPHP